MKFEAAAVDVMGVAGSLPHTPVAGDGPGAGKAAKGPGKGASALPALGGGQAPSAASPLPFSDKYGQWTVADVAEAWAEWKTMAAKARKSPFQLCRCVCLRVCVCPSVCPSYLRPPACC